jgi:hypothetical protein
MKEPGKSSEFLIRMVLAMLVLTDLVLSAWGFLLPDLWFSVFHDSARIDPQALLQRCAANWAAFLAIQLLALFRWKRESWWLPVVAGCRLGDVLTDITCLAMCEKISWLGAIAFPVAGIMNLVAGIWLIRAYRQLEGAGER